MSRTSLRRLVLAVMASSGCAVADQAGVPEIEEEIPEEAPPQRRDAAPAADARPPDAAAEPPRPDAAPAPDQADPDTGADAQEDPGDAAALVMDARPSTGSPLTGIGSPQMIRSGYSFAEGARWSPALGRLLFADVYGSTIYQLTPPDRIEVYRKPSNRANGLELGPDGALLAAEIDGRVSRTPPGGSTVSAVRDFGGLQVKAPNDLVVLPDGTIFYSDTSLRRLMRISPEGKLSHALGGDDPGPNGLLLSPDKRTLYVGYPGLTAVRAFTLDASGRPTAMRTFARTSANPDGMCADVEHNVYVGTSAGLEVFSPSGSRWGTLRLPGLQAGDRATKCAFAGTDARTLYVIARSKVFRVPMVKPGVH